MKSKLMWFYQDVEEQELQVNSEASNKPSTSRMLQASSSRTNLLQQTVPVVRKKLFLTDGWDVPLTGICIYIFRTNTNKQLPEEGFQKVKPILYGSFTVCILENVQDLFCGIIDAQRIGLVTTIERIVECVYMEALAHPSPDTEDEASNCPMVKNQLLPGLRSFCSALKGIKNVTSQQN